MRGPSLSLQPRVPDTTPAPRSSTPPVIGKAIHPCPPSSSLPHSPPSSSPPLDDDQPPPLVLEEEGEGEEEGGCVMPWGDLYALKVQFLGPFLFGQQTLSEEVCCHGSWPGQGRVVACVYTSSGGGSRSA